MRDRDKIEEESRDSNVPYEALMLELLLDIREQLDEIKQYLKHKK